LSRAAFSAGGAGCDVMAKRPHKGPGQVANLLDMYRALEGIAPKRTKPVYLIFALIEHFKLPYERASFEEALWLAAKHGLIRIPGSAGRPIGGRLAKVSKEALKKRRQRDAKTWPESDNEKLTQRPEAVAQMIDVLLEIDWRTAERARGTK
jgi:hypothetical protein